MPRLRPPIVRVSVVEPGAVASSFVANAGSVPAELLTAVGPYAPGIGRYLGPTRQQFRPGARAFVGTKLADLDGSAVGALTSTCVT